MSLIIEDGTGVEDANTFVDMAEARTIASTRGIELAEDDAELSGQLVQSADRISAYEPRFSGVRQFSTQCLAYPRLNAYRFGAAVPRGTIPRELKLAQVVMCGMLEQGVELWTASSAGIKEETVGPLKTVYADSAAESVGNPDLPQVESTLSGLFLAVTGNFRMGR